MKAFCDSGYFYTKHVDSILEANITQESFCGGTHADHAFF